LFTTIAHDLCTGTATGIAATRERAALSDSTFGTKEAAIHPDRSVRISSIDIGGEGFLVVFSVKGSRVVEIDPACLIHNFAATRISGWCEGVMG
jgi:hypothetical protein